MGVKVTGFSELNVSLKKIGVDLNTVEDRVIAPHVSQLRNDMIKRTQSGYDANMTLFTPYSEAYKKSDIYKKKKAGQTGVNMTLFGKMVRSVRWGKFSNGFMIFLPSVDEEKKGLAHQIGAGKLPVRKWFGLSKPSIKKFFDGVKKSMETM